MVILRAKKKSHRQKCSKLREAMSSVTVVIWTADSPTCRATVIIEEEAEAAPHVVISSTILRACHGMAIELR